MSRLIENPKELILGKAQEILYRDGYQKLSMRTLAKECEIALGTIYNYYPTKKELITEMMEGYWMNYLKQVRKIAGSETEFYRKLKDIYNELVVVIRNFRQFWLTTELYDEKECVENGLQKEYGFMEELIRILEEVLLDGQAKEELQIKQGAHNTAGFIMMNFITMVQRPLFSYEVFEQFLKELLR